MTNKQLVDAAAHQLVADWSIQGLLPPDKEEVGTAIYVGSIRVMVSMVKDDGPTKLFHDEHGRGCIGAPPETPRASTLKDCILEAAPAANERPITMKLLASRAGYCYTKHFRDAVAELETDGKLIRTRQGIRRTT
jgi:hypothetical protein